MTNVVSIPGVAPPARWDGVPYTIVLVDEAPGPGGPWSLIDTRTLSDPDADPTAPAVRNVTTSLAVLELGWYHVRFRDGAGGTSGPAGLVRNSVLDSPLPPAPEEIREQSPLLRAKYPQPESDPTQAADLRTQVYQATAMVMAATWRLIDPSLGDAAPEGYSSEAVPDALIPVAFQAIARMAERLQVTSAPALAEQIATGRRLRGFSAGPYSESYFAPGEFARRGAQQGRAPMDADDALDAALWALATENARDYFTWRATGVALPAGTVSSWDYRRMSIGYQAGGGGYVRGAGPDGW